MRFLPTAQIPASARGASIALGNFDGVHRGHQAVLAAARAAAPDAPLAAAVFEPHPRRFFQPDAPPFRLQTPEQRARALAQLGAAFVFEIGFDRTLSQLTDAEFAEQILSKRLGASHVTVGADYRFGRGRMGDAASLAELGKRLGFGVTALAPVSRDGGEKISSSAIREALVRGDVAEATRLLGRPWAIEGEVRPGFARGRDLGFPTANISLGDYQRPRFGIYAVRIDIGAGERKAGVASIGINPTFGALAEPVLEAHLFDHEDDLYGRMIEAQVIAFLRDEAHFANPEALTRQMHMDAEHARAALAAHKT